MKFVKLPGKVQLTDESDVTIQMFDFSDRPCPHPDNENLIVIKTDTNRNQSGGTKIDWRDVTVPVITDRDSLLVALATSFFFRVVTEGGGDMLKATYDVANKNSQITVDSEKSNDIETDKESTVKFPIVKAVYDWATGLFAKLVGGNSFTGLQAIKGITSDGTTNIIELKNSDDVIVEKVDTNGFMKPVYDDILPSNDWVAAPGGAAPDVTTHTIAGIDFNYQSFDGGGTEERTTNVFEILHGIDIASLNNDSILAEIHTHGRASTTAAGVVKIFFDLAYCPVNSATITWGSFSVLITISANERYFQKMVGVTLAKPTSGFNIGDLILCRYRRTPNDAQDTYTGDWLFDQCAMHMPFNSNGSRQRYVK